MEHLLTFEILKSFHGPGLVDSPIIPALGRLRQEDHHEFKASLGSIVSSRRPELHSCVSKKIFFCLRKILLMSFL